MCEEARFLWECFSATFFTTQTLNRAWAAWDIQRANATALFLITFFIPSCLNTFYGLPPLGRLSVIQLFSSWAIGTNRHRSCITRSSQQLTAFRGPYRYRGQYLLLLTDQANISTIFCLIGFGFQWVSWGCACTSSTLSFKPQFCHRKEVQSGLENQKWWIFDERSSLPILILILFIETQLFDWRFGVFGIRDSSSSSGWGAFQ